MLGKIEESIQEHALYINGIPIANTQLPLSEYSVFGSIVTYRAVNKGEWTIFVKTMGNKNVVPIIAGFMNCKYRTHGIKDATGEQYTSEWRIVKPEACYELFPHSKQAIWRRLLIETLCLDDDESCVICLKPMKDVGSLGCGHRFHGACYAAWRSTCPVCRFKQTLD
ncbi:hypothetical protein BGZ54_002361 [Gamsiella multidivaricata]|nr:hypothetical protein BGZ54_002361 [Gamsiella multidivaricata]